MSHLVSCPHTHQQNGAAERKHRHIVEVGLSFLAHASMPLKFWDEAFSTAVFLINRLPSRVIDFATPLEKLHKVKPDYEHMHTFGCACWPNLRPYNTDKLAFHSKRCVFLGYSSMHKGYKCLDVSTGRVYVSRDVIFDETVFPFESLHPNAGAKLRAKISLLYPSLLHPQKFGVKIVNDHDAPNLSNDLDESCDDVLRQADDADDHDGAGLEGGMHMHVDQQVDQPHVDQAHLDVPEQELADQAAPPSRVVIDMVDAEPAVESPASTTVVVSPCRTSP